jgi:hypothetical protein
LQTDPYQLNNLYPTTSHAGINETRILGRSLNQAINRLDALLMVLKSCQGVTCIQPWDVLQPVDPVSTLQHALNKEYDGFYGAQPQVSFDWCDSGYIVEAEGAQVPLTSRHGVSWDVWV